MTKNQNVTVEEVLAEPTILTPKKHSFNKKAIAIRAAAVAVVFVGGVLLGKSLFASEDDEFDNDTTSDTEDVTEEVVFETPEL